MKQPTKDQLREQLRLAAEENIRLNGVLDDWLARPPVQSWSGGRRYTYPDLVEEAARVEKECRAAKANVNREWWRRYLGWLK